MYLRILGSAQIGAIDQAIRKPAHDHKGLKQRVAESSWLRIPWILR